MKANTVCDKESALKECSENNYNEIDDIREIKRLESKLKENPDELATLHMLGNAYARNNDLANAENIFNRELKLSPQNCDAYFNLGLIYCRQNRIPEAIESFENVIKFNPDDIRTLNDLGVLHFSSGNIDRAKNLFSEALNRDHAYKEAFLNIFELLWENEKYGEALEYAQKYLLKLSNQTTTKTKPEVASETKSQAQPPKTVNIISPDMMAPDMPKIIESAMVNKHKQTKSNSNIEALFNKHVPENIRVKKTGLNIAVIADYNIAGQLTSLFRLINEHTIHRARCIIIQNDYLSYDKDLILSANNPDDWEEARQIIQNADFFHIGRFPLQNDQFPLLRCLKPDNTIVQYFGSEIRQNAGAIYNWHVQNKITGVAAWDYTMIQRSPLFYHINMMFDASKVKPAPKPEGTLKIIHPSTNRNIKKTEIFLNAMAKLKGKYDIEPIIVEGKTNEECLEMKSRSHMTYDQISVGIYGVSAIESMAAGHVVFGGISNFAASVYPDNPIVWITPENLTEKIIYYTENRDEITKCGLAGKTWVKQHHDPHKILKQHLYLYDLVKNGHRFVPSPDEQLLG